MLILALQEDLFVVWFSNKKTPPSIWTAFLFIYLIKLKPDRSPLNGRIFGHTRVAIF
jgi:hypothetical protein